MTASGWPTWCTASLRAIDDAHLGIQAPLGGDPAQRRGQVVKTHPRQPADGRSTDPADLPEHKTGYGLRDLTRLIAACAAHGVVNLVGLVGWLGCVGRGGAG
jgi:hypothetical protein